MPNSYITLLLLLLALMGALIVYTTTSLSHVKLQDFTSIASFRNILRVSPEDPLGGADAEAGSFTQVRSLRTFDIWPAYKPEADVSLTYFQTKCAHVTSDEGVMGIMKLQEEWVQSRDPLCKELFRKFITIFSTEVSYARVKIPDPFKTKVRGWLGNNEQLFKEVFNQTTISIVNHMTQEHTIFNPLREKRPVSKPDIPEKEYFDTMIRDSEKNCDFCRYKNFTAEHHFGRVESLHSFSASNIFKLGALHAIIASKSHNPLTLDLEKFLDLMHLTLTWTAKANYHHPQAVFPGFVWDVLPKCGASQVHPHLQGTLDMRSYRGVQEVWRVGAQEYHNLHSSNYFSDVTAIHSVLNLTARYGQAVALVNIVPKKDHEVVVMAESASDDFFKLLYCVTKALTDDLGKMCFSMGMAYPAIGVSEGKIPAYARIITRGAITEIRSDISSFELWMAGNVNIDPYKTVQLVRESVAKRLSLV